MISNSSFTIILNKKKGKNKHNSFSKQDSAQKIENVVVSVHHTTETNLR